LLLVLVVPSIGDASRGSQIDRLRSRNVAISAERQAAVVRLYALDAKFAQAEARLLSVQERLTSVRRERSEIRHALEIARHGVTVADRRLAQRLRLLYEQDDVSPVEIVLGAASLDDALSALENLDHAAALDRHVLEELRAARTQLGGLDRSLAEREASLGRLAAEAAATAQSLAGARQERATYIARLGREQRLTRTRIAALQEQARKAELRSRSLVRAGGALPAPASPSASADDGSAVPAAAPAPLPPQAGGDGSAPADAPRTMTVVATGYSIHGNTATGLPTGWGIAAVDPAVIALGTRITVPGYGEAVAADVGSGVRGATVDLWFPTVGQALAWGRRTVTIVLH
jgi:cystine transport system substrate-binding protein